jgi:hypothetical protein
MSALHHGAYPSRQPGLWIVIAAVMLVIGMLVVVLFTAAGAPQGATELPSPQPAPVGP